MASCRNPECDKGLNPGVVIVGAGSKGRPVVGEGARPPSYRWGWTRCLACNADDESRKRGITYKHVNRSPAEIAQRKELANSKAPYQPESVVGKALGGLRGQNSNAGRIQGTIGVHREGGADQSAQITRLLETNTKLAEQVSKLSTQISELLDDNRALRKALDAYSGNQQRTEIIPTPPRHDMGT